MGQRTSEEPWAVPSGGEMAADTDLIRRARALYEQLVEEARAAIPGMGARRASEKSEYCRALWLVAARVREWLVADGVRISRFVALMARTEADVSAAMAAAKKAPDAKRSGWSCGLYRALSLLMEAFEAAGRQMEVGGETVSIRGALVDGRLRFRLEKADPGAEAREAEAAFFEEAERVLGRGETAGQGSAREREERDV